MPPDANLSYNQILIVKDDKLKTTFITKDANYHDEVMPFGLKNASATYQRLIDKVFNHLIGKNVEAYVDDMVVKSPTQDQHSKTCPRSSQP